MSVSINNLFNYSRSLPVPFDTMTNKKVKVASMYGAKTESTLCGSVIKAVHAMCRCMNGTGEGAVGQIDTNKSVAEYKSSVGPDAYHLVVFDAASGSALASVYDKNTELIEQYVAHPSQRDGAAIFFALMPFLMSDAEFDETFQEYYDQFIAGYPDMAKATESMAILCDNAYRRIKDDTCPAHINITVDKSGNLMRVSQGQLDSGSFVPTSVTAGEFTIFAKTGPAVIKKAGVVVEHTDFVGKYPLTPGRTLSALELSLIPKLPEWYIIPPEVVDICKHGRDRMCRRIPGIPDGAGGQRHGRLLPQKQYHRRCLRNAQPDRLGHQCRDLRRPLSVGKVYGHQQSHCRRGRPGSPDYNHSGPYVCPKAEANIGISPEERRTTLYGKSES